MVDGAQSVPHLPVDVNDIGCDFLVFSGHKMLAPMGIGVLYGRRELLEQMAPFLYGGGMIDDVYLDDALWNRLPWKFEAGTPNIAGAIALAGATDRRSGFHLEGATDYLNPGGRLLIEMDPRQTSEVVTTLEASGYYEDMRRIQDYSQRYRVVLARKRKDVSR